MIGLGDYAAVRALHDRVLAFLDRDGGADHPSYPFIAYALGRALIDRQAYDEARFYAEQALAARERNLDPDNEWIAWTADLTALVWERTGRLEDATALFERALGILEQARGPEHADLSSLLTNLGWNLTRQERFEEALPLHERSVRVIEASLGSRHPRIVPALDGLGHLYWRTRRYEESRVVGERALAIQEDRLGRDHPDVVRRYYNLACLGARSGDRDEAMSRLREAVDRGFRWGGIVDDPDLDSLRGDPEFEAIVREVERRVARESS